MLDHIPLLRLWLPIYFIRASAAYLGLGGGMLLHLIPYLGSEEIILGLGLDHAFRWNFPSVMKGNLFYGKCLIFELVERQIVYTTTDRGTLSRVQP